jgi:hypothetical protein
MADNQKKQVAPPEQTQTYSCLCKQAAPLVQIIIQPIVTNRLRLLCKAEKVCVKV